MFRSCMPSCVMRLLTPGRAMCMPNGVAASSCRDVQAPHALSRFLADSAACSDEWR